LPAILHGEKAPASPAEQVEFGRLCALKKMNVAGARFFAEAFAAQHEPADDMEGSNRYDAACCAALAGCGRGVDAETLTEEERASWRRKALDWLQADLAY
jgi:hypothetical protein